MIFGTLGSTKSLEARKHVKKNGHSGLTSLNFKSHLTIVIILMAEFAWVKICYHIACIHPALSVSSVAGCVFMDGTCVTGQWVLCAFGVGKVFLCE